MDIPPEKWLVMALLTAISAILGIIPCILVRCTKSTFSTESLKYQVMLTLLSCFGAGVLFSTSMLHLLPEIRERFREIPSVWTTFDTHFPVAEVVVIGGFCVIYLVEEIAHIMVDGHHHHIKTRHNSSAHAVPIPNIRNSITSSSKDSVRSRQLKSAICITMMEDESNEDIRESSQDEQDMSSAALPCEGTNSDTEDQRPDERKNLASSLRTFLGLIALSFHAIMEGVTVGLQDSTNVWMMFGAVASHKFVISFCMGMELAGTGTKLSTHIGSIIIFAVLSPTGIIIGSILVSDDTTNNLPVTVIEGLACGTLLYVVFFEILNRERERKSYSMSNSKAIGFAQFFTLVVGLVGMGCLLTLTHGHSTSTQVDSHNH